MGTAFATALDVLATDPDGSVAGTFTPAGGTTVPVRIVIGKNDSKSDFFSDGVRHAGWTAWMRKSEVAAKPKEQDTLVASEGPHAGTYRVLDAWSDAEGLSWYCDLAEAA
jgi:hypothetical protein